MSMFRYLSTRGDLGRIRRHALVAVVAGGAGLLAAASRPAPFAADAPAPNAPAAAAVTHRVRMVGDGTSYRFEPARLTVSPGDRVAFVLVSGAPHNVQFYADSVPAAARAKLAANMPETTDELTGPLLMQDGATYTVSFAGLPAGTYKYVCTPHAAMNMKGQIVVRAAGRRAAAR